MGATDLLDEILPPWAGRSTDTPEELLARLAPLGPDEAEAMPFFHPRLLQPAVVTRLEAAAATPQEQVAAGRLRFFRNLLDAHRLEYPFGLGPIERLSRATATGEISLAEAERLAAHADVSGQLHDSYVEALGRLGVRMATDEQLAPQAVELLRITLAATLAAPEAERGALVIAASRGFVECARVALVERPDDALYADARSVADVVVASARDSDPPTLSDALSALGRLELDPYCASLSAANFENDLEHWRRRAVPSPEGTPPMPAPREALRDACEHLREAAALGLRERAPSILKPLVQGLYYRHRVFGDVPAREVVAAAREALAVIDAERDPDRRLFVERVLAEVEGASAPTVDDGFDLPAAVERLGRRRALELTLMRAGAMSDPAAVLALLDQAKPLAEGLPIRSRLLTVEVEQIGRGIAPDLTDTRKGTAKRLGKLRKRARRQRWPDAQLGAALIRMSLDSQHSDEEALGLELLEEGMALAPATAAERAEALRSLRGVLRFRDACNYGLAGNRLEAINRYQRALADHIASRDEDACLICLERTVQDGLTDPKLAQYAIASLGSHAADIRTAFEVRATDVLMNGLYELSRTLVDTSASIEVALLLQQAAKAARFGVALRERGPVDLRGSEDLLVTIAQDERALRERAGEDGGERPTLDEPTLLTAYVQPEEAEAGATAAARLANLQRSYDRLTAKRLYAQRAHGMGYAGLDVIQDRLDERTVFLTMYLGAGPQGPSVHTIAITSDSYDVSVIPLHLPMQQVELEIAGARSTLHPLGVIIAMLREQLAEKPDFRLVDPTAEQTLRHNLPQYFGKFAGLLDTWRRHGRDHLCIWAHGPLHFLPFGLFDAGGAPLAEHWTVTTVPSVMAFVGAPATPGGRLLAIGCGEGGEPFGLAPVPEMERQAEDVAGLLSARALTGPTATRERFLAALEDAEYVHVAAHGAHNVNAPAFQCLYLNPGEGESRVFAHDVMTRDLRKVKLVTLSACETALGRFDRGDDLRGLPAALMAAGASAIIGTSWPVEPDPASAFFTTLYARLADGDGRLAAFRAAQVHTREHFPHYCDWGAFVYMGDWREEAA